MEDRLTAEDDEENDESVGVIDDAMAAIIESLTAFIESAAERYVFEGV
jgi:hypothetical protein